MAIIKPQGTNDFLPGGEDISSEKLQKVEELLREICREYGYGEIRTPIFEYTELFQRGVGETTDIVQKEMYTFADRGGRSITLRPENTASTCRAFGEHKLYGRPQQPQKLYYIGPMFRCERPQAGRFRQFHQFGIEVIGTNSPFADAEAICLAWDIYSRLGLKDLELHLNSVGCPKCRAEYRKALQEHLRPALPQLCGTCQDRFERNPMRILDCKNPNCKNLAAGAPTIDQYLCQECAGHFASVQAILTASGIPYHLDSRLVRGLDYYTKTAFEILSGGIGAQSAVCGGGRYDGLMEEVCGQSIPAVGFAAGIERIFGALKAQGLDIEVETGLDVYVIATGDDAAAQQRAFALGQELRKAGLRVDFDLLSRGMKAQFKAANREGARFAVILGGDEFARGVAQVKDMQAGEQVEVALAEVTAHIQSKMA
ncbi:MAG: histidine--tRNA ligase [Firmicutes bacterium]|nr:histidine--tRNA ligase [Bacillota bacterium]